MSGDCASFQYHYVRAKVGIYGVFIILFAIAAVSWIVFQRRIHSSFKVVRWYNHGLALLLWNFFIIAQLITYTIPACAATPLFGTVAWRSAADSWRSTLAKQILFHLAMVLLLITVLLPINNGLDRLRGAQKNDSRSRAWRIAAIILTCVYALLLTIYLSLLAWQAASIINLDIRRAAANDLLGPFPEYVYVYAALMTLWLLCALVAIAKILLLLLAFNNHAQHDMLVPTSLRVWAGVLAFGLFGNGFLYVFDVYYYTIGRHFNAIAGNAVAVSVAWQVLYCVFGLVPVVAVGEVARRVSAVLASAGESAAHGNKNNNSNNNKNSNDKADWGIYDPEGGPSRYSGSTR